MQLTKGFKDNKIYTLKNKKEDVKLRVFLLFIGMLAILKIGCSYLPIDIEYPKERIEYIVNDSKTKCRYQTLCS